MVAPTAFIFDMDGTLVDTSPLHIKSWARAFHEYGIEAFPEQIQAQIGRRAIEIANALLPAHQKYRAGEIVETKWSIFREYLDQVRPFPMVKELFDELGARGVKLALATSTNRHDAQFYVTLLSIRSTVGALIAAEDIRRSKPDPEIFLRAAQALGVDPKDSVVVGDSPHDIRAAVNAGMRPIGVLTGGYSREVLELAGTRELFSDIADLYRNIDKVL